MLRLAFCGALLGAIVLPTALAAREPARFVPVFETDFADPFVLPVGNGYLAYATNPSGLRANVQVARSYDLKRWSVLGTPEGKLHDAMPVLPAWARAGFTWAPEVVRAGNRYVLYFTAREKKSDLQCIGAAVSTSALGPFASTAAEPLVCQRELGGSIDPNVFRDTDGTLYLYYKSDGNNPRVLKPSQIFAQRLSGNGLRLEGDPRPLIRNDQHWEWRVVESPAMVRGPTGYTLFFSANHFGWEADQRLSNYAMGYATCAGPMGPCTKAPENPILLSYNDKRGCLSGPGHQTVFEAGGRKYLAFHAWSATAKCRPAGKGRYMYIAPLDWRGTTPVLGTSLR